MMTSFALDKGPSSHLIVLRRHGARHLVPGAHSRLAVARSKAAATRGKKVACGVGRSVTHPDLIRSNDSTLLALNLMTQAAILRHQVFILKQNVAIERL